MLVKISNSIIKQLLPGEKEYDVRDINLKGFLIRVQPSGNMIYVCQYKRGRRVNLGKVGVISAAQAREKAIEVLTIFIKGLSRQSKRELTNQKRFKNLLKTNISLGLWLIKNEERKHSQPSIDALRAYILNLLLKSPLLF
ncbi:site-specific recombinase XerD [Legionella wadsworthii]|uniref:Site-specific recombinase XerD n=1 Tax=Legionella wadsworthii TaxID=28088 RepID=A0A378LT59_9GAMM|nr:Arm DNA-binding domain-containing protein [Legionella wadsworthii]STY30349.1 site-specific recombinase XerD [Legionella wadsworthii]